MSIHQPLPDKIAADWPPPRWADVTSLVAVSGGADSVALLRALEQLRQPGAGRLLVAHFNHRLRGPDADEDERFVATLSERLNLECVVGRAEAPGTLDSEQSARAARYDFLRRTAGQRGARFVVTAHTADDQAETILHRIVRGTGVAGLSGIPRVRQLGPAVLLRPMLGVRRGEVTAYLDWLGQTFRTDASNRKSRFTRNRLRHELLPRLAADYNPAVVDALLRLGRLAGEAQQVIDATVAELAERHVKREPAETIMIDAAAVADRPRYVMRELIMHAWRRQGWPQQAMGYEQWDHLAEMLLAAGHGEPVARRMFPGPVAVESEVGRLRLHFGP